MISRSWRLKLVAGLLAIVVAMVPAIVSAQSVNSIYISSPSGNFAVGSTFTVAIRENTAAAVNAVQADLKYSSNLEFVSIDAAGSAFSIDASSTGGNGAVSTARGTTVPVSGDQLVAKVTFKIIAAGNGSIQVQDSSVALSASNNTNVVSSRSGGNYGLLVAGGTVPTPPPTVTAPAPNPSPTTESQSSRRQTTTGQPQTAIVRQGSSQTAPLGNDGKVELSAPATITTTPDPQQTVSKVEYLVNGTIVETDIAAPYSYTFDTTAYRNGTYTLTTKTYYANGQVDTANASIIVNNPLSARSVFLQLKHYAWLIVIILIVVAELVYLKFFRKPKPTGPRPPMSGFGGGMPSSGSVVRPGGPGNGAAAAVTWRPPTEPTIQPTPPGQRPEVAVNNPTPPQQQPPQNP